MVVSFDEFVKRHALLGAALPDHLCYKCASHESYEAVRALLEGESMYLHQSIISKRRISIIKLRQGIDTVLGKIFYVELSDQKPDNSQEEGFDHIEVYPTAHSYDEMVSGLGQTELVIKVERPHHTTHDIEMAGGYIFRCTREPLIEKIKRTEIT